MLFHLSIAAQDPRRVATVIAEIWGGEALPFPPVCEGCWIAFAGDERATAMEIYPIDARLKEAEGDADAYGERGHEGHYTATHAAIATYMSQDQILAIAKREGWPAKYRKRGDQFGVIELWMEGRQMIELLTPEMQQEYFATTTIANWKAMIAAGPINA